MSILKRSALLLMLSLAAGPAAAREPWQLSHGPFVTASDVREHNQLGADLRDLREFLAKPQPDWAGALQLYAFGRNFKNHALGRFADDYNGRLASHLPRSTKHFGSPSFQAHAWTAALIKSSRFARASDAERVAFLAEAAPALVVNWARYELGESERKAKANPPNWALTNGSPKNWNEIFAFYLGPEARHAAFAAVEAAPGGVKINEKLFATLAAGQEILLKQGWPAEQGAAVRVLLDQASLVLLRQALTPEPEADLALVQQRAAGAWLAAAEATLASPEAVQAVEAALADKPDRQALAAAAKAVSGLITP